MKTFKTFREDFSNQHNIKIQESNRIAYDLYIKEWLNFIDVPSISELSPKQFQEFTKLTENWKNNIIFSFEKPNTDKIQLNESQIAIIKDIFKVCDFETAKSKLMNFKSLEFESIQENENTIELISTKFMPLTIQRVGRDRDTLEYEARKSFQEKLGTAFDESQFLSVFNSMYEYANGIPEEFYNEMETLLKK